MGCSYFQYILFLSFEVTSQLNKIMEDRSIYVYLKHWSCINISRVKIYIRDLQVNLPNTLVEDFLVWLEEDCTGRAKFRTTLLLRVLRVLCTIGTHLSHKLQPSLLEWKKKEIRYTRISSHYDIWYLLYCTGIGTCGHIQLDGIWFRVLVALQSHCFHRDWSLCLLSRW